MTNEVAKNETRPLTIGERFTNMVLRELQASVGKGVQVTEKQRSLIMGYFIGILCRMVSRYLSRRRINLPEQSSFPSNR